MSSTPSVAELFETLDYGPAPESAGGRGAWLEARGGRFGHFIGGVDRGPGGGDGFTTFNPADGTALAEVTQGSPEDVDRAVAAAKGGLPGVAGTSGGTCGPGTSTPWVARSRSTRPPLRRPRDAGQREAHPGERDLDIPLVARHFHHHAGWAQILGDALPHHRPLGVVGQIIPWNFPLLMLAWKVAPALACGNTVVLKPAEFTSLTALLFAASAEGVGLPPGVVNIVTGDGRTGAALVRHPVAKIAFTGSTEVGRIIRRETAGSGKRISLELGGKSPFVVFDDADLDSVVEGVVDAIWFNQGEVCCAGSRILVHEGTASPSGESPKARMETLRMGDPLDKAVDMGAMVAPVQLEQIRKLVEQGRAEGAEIWQPSGALPGRGASILRPCAPGWSRPVPWPRWRSSGRSWSS
jgi:aldehyde dehydrogenase (NAD+)